MIEETGIVIELLDNKNIAKIIVEKNSACGNCSAKSFCHTFGEESEITVNALNTINAAKGDKVKIAIKSSTFLKASFLVYLIPIIAMLTGSFLGEIFFHNDIVNFLFAGIFFIVSFYLVSKFTNNKPNQYMAEVIEVL